MNRSKGIILMFICTIFTAIGQILLKKGTDILVFDIISIITNFPLILGVFFYALGALLLIYALKHGELNVLYRIVSLTFVWVIMLSYVFLNETVSFSKITGTSTILLGVLLITKGGKK